jgi:hypothetical protein
VSGAGLVVGVLGGALFGAAVFLVGRRRGRTVLGVEGLIATLVLGLLFGVLVAAAVAAVFALGIRRLPRLGSGA